MSKEYVCDGETVFGFTVSKCEKEGKHLVNNTPHEQYAFCSEHLYFYYNGKYPDGSGSRAKKTEKEK